MLTDAPVVVQADGRIHSVTTAVSWPYRWNRVDGPGSHLAAGRILVTVLLLRGPGRFAASPGFGERLRLPLLLGQAQRVKADGIPTELRFLRSTDACDVDIRVDFGDIRPSAAERTAVQSVLDGLVPPHGWPR